MIFNRVLQFKQNCKSVLYFDALKMKSISLLMNIWARVTSSSEGVQAKDSAFWCFEHWIDFSFGEYFASVTSSRKGVQAKEFKQKILLFGTFSIKLIYLLVNIRSRVTSSRKGVQAKELKGRSWNKGVQAKEFKQRILLFGAFWSICWSIRPSIRPSQFNFLGFCVSGLV